VIDEGNHGYFFQVGINGTSAQYEVSKFLGEECKKLVDGKVLDYDTQLLWLDEMFKKFKGCSKELIKKKGMLPTTEMALLK
jgi:hypothetical protein